MAKTEWFDEWFDSPYYHILYKHRDYEEAKNFIDNLISYFKINPEHRVLDLACGKGRHSIYLNEKGFEVTGLDLSERNIAEANKHANDRLHFDVHDMREEYKKEAFDFVLNMFTSFGYFKTESENESAICTVATALKPGGFFLLDFLNPYRVINSLVKEEKKSIEGIDFYINRKLNTEGFIEKNIQFSDRGKKYNYTEKVKAIRRIEFLNYFRKANLRLVATFGDYNLNGYEPEHSERMIFVTQKQV